MQFRLLYNTIPEKQPHTLAGLHSYARAMSNAADLPSQAAHLRWSDIAVEPLNPLLSRQFITGEQAMLARIDLKRGATVPRHSHPNEQISWITEGAVRFTLGGAGDERELIVRAGEVLVIPGDLPHAAEALEDTVDFDIFAPPRQDWINKDDAYLR